MDRQKREESWEIVPAEPERRSYCSSCGAALRPDDRFCSSCGAPTAAAPLTARVPFQRAQQWVPPQAPQQPPVFHAPQQNVVVHVHNRPVKKPVSIWRFVIAIIILVIILAAVGGPG